MKKYKVENFVYNGFYVESKEGNADYTATFNSWTSDPGVIKADCSDGKVRLIPTCCLIGCKESDFPPQPKTGVLFGSASKS